MWVVGVGRSQSEQSNRPDDWATKKVAFEMRDKPWGAVLEWLADETGLPVIPSNVKPTGSFTFIAPKKADPHYTIPEVIDILNEALTGQNMIILRVKRTCRK